MARDNQNAAPAATYQILRWPEVQKKTGICRSHAHALAQAGTFPKPIKLGPRASGWISSEIDEWLRSRVEASRGLSS